MLPPCKKIPSMQRKKAYRFPVTVKRCQKLPGNTGKSTIPDRHGKAVRLQNTECPDGRRNTAQHDSIAACGTHISPLHAVLCHGHSPAFRQSRRVHVYYTGFPVFRQEVRESFFMGHPICFLPRRTAAVCSDLPEQCEKNIDFLHYGWYNNLTV